MYREKSGYVLIRGIDTGGSVTVHRSEDGRNTIVTDGQSLVPDVGDGDDA